VQAGRLPADGLVRPMNALSDMLDALFAGRYPGFSWRVLMEGDQAGAEAAVTELDQGVLRALIWSDGRSSA